ncbi:DUF4336 domain-containing protein [Bradyrhizobium sp. SZCCHNPS1003]|uniref:DUF4336 domain-containing protein n=1 Tax=Bradyrhizobium sp. SZCCHNPS1003 TaxID=3057330 RepID=UPI0028EF1933|nr:DUF4336 domain-containing protein [Bradyrhizobium sp. SZCCHNPS1003]
MSRTPSLYDPINEYKPFAPGIGVVDGPFEYLTMAGVTLPLPFSTRMTVVQLQNGELFLHSPIALDLELARHLRSIGSISHLVSPNQFHYAHIGEWSRAFPDATTWGSPGARRRARARGIDVRFDDELTSTPPPAWGGEIDQTAIPGGIFGEIVFFHRASRTLILTDTIINLELDKISEPWRSAAHLTGMYHPNGQIFFGMRLPLLLHRRRARAAIDRVLSWDPEHIVVSHGRCFEANGRQVLDRFFAWYA